MFLKKKKMYTLFIHKIEQIEQLNDYFNILDLKMHDTLWFMQ